MTEREKKMLYNIPQPLREKDEPERGAWLGWRAGRHAEARPRTDEAMREMLGCSTDVTRSALTRITRTGLGRRLGEEETTERGRERENKKRKA